MRTRAALFFALRILGSAAMKRGGGRVGPSVSRQTGLGTRYLRGAIVGISLSLIPFIVVLVVADGMIEGITSRYLETYSYHFQASSIELLDARDSASAAKTIARDVPEVLGAWPETRGAAVALYKGESAPTMIRGIDPELLFDEGFRRYLSLSQGVLAFGKNGILVGKSLADSLGIKVGDSLSLLTAGGADGADHPKASMFRVTAVVSAGYRDLDELWIFIPLASADRILPPVSRLDLIGIKVAHPYANPEATRQALLKALTGTVGGSLAAASWNVRPWKEVERNLFASFAATRSLLLVIMALTIGVAAMNVSSALIMLVLERSRDIAILKSAGASKGFIAQVFLIAGAATGALGTIIGISMGAILAWRVNDLIALLERFITFFSSAAALFSGSSPPPTIKLLNPAYYLEKIPVRLDVAELALVATASVFICLAVSVLPALRAARLPPLEIFIKS